MTSQDLPLRLFRSQIIEEQFNPFFEANPSEMDPSTIDEAPALVPTGIPLSYLLPPNNIVNIEPDGCPTALCGPMLASTVLHLAIGHNVSSKDYARLCSMRGSAMQQDTMPVDFPKDRQNYTWVMTSSRAILHSKLAEEDEPFLREHGGHPIVKEALNRTEFRYCQTAEQCLLLLQLLHGPPSSADGSDPAIEDGPREPDSMAEHPTLLIAYDLLRLFLAAPSDVDAEEKEGDVDMEAGRQKVELREGVTIEDYMQLMACLRSTVSQISPNSPPQLLILEPSLPPDDLKFPLATSTSRGGRPGGQGNKKDRPGVKDALRWLFGVDQVWDVEYSAEPAASRPLIEKVGKGRLVVRSPVSV